MQILCVLTRTYTCMTSIIYLSAWGSPPYIIHMQGMKDVNLYN